MNLSLALPDALREVSIDGVPYVLVRRSALDALYPGNGAGHRTARSSVARAASATSSRPRLKARSRLPVARSAAQPEPDISKPVSGALRGGVLATIQQNPGQTSLEIFDVIRHKIPTTTSGSVYQAIKSWVKKELVTGQQTDEGTMGWHPVRSARKAGGNKVTLNSRVPVPNTPGAHQTASPSAEARGAA